MAADDTTDEFTERLTRPAECHPACAPQYYGTPLTFDPRWRTETVVALASGIDVDIAYDRLPILADALEEAGCDHPDILSHCRHCPVHVPGCWVVSLVLDTHSPGTRPDTSLPVYPRPTQMTAAEYDRLEATPKRFAGRILITLGLLWGMIGAVIAVWNRVSSPGVPYQPDPNYNRNYTLPSNARERPRASSRSNSPTGQLDQAPATTPRTGVPKDSH